jgi:hypothetical protein
VSVSWLAARHHPTAANTKPAPAPANTFTRVIVVPPGFFERLRERVQWPCREDLIL